jgi:hypothetical protein
VWRIRDVYPGSDFFHPGSDFFHPGSELSPSRILVKEFKYFNPKKVKKWFLSSKKYDPRCSSLIPDPDPGVKKAPNPGSATLFFSLYFNFIEMLMGYCLHTYYFFKFKDGVFHYIRTQFPPPPSL